MGFDTVNLHRPTVEKTLELKPQFMVSRTDIATGNENTGISVIGTIKEFKVWEMKVAMELDITIITTP